MAKAGGDHPSERSRDHPPIPKEQRRYSAALSRAYTEGAVLAKRDKAFAARVMAKYLGTQDREMLDDAYERVTRHLEIPPYPTCGRSFRSAKNIGKDPTQSPDGEPRRFYRCPIAA